ncbi:MAG: hypothetical protein KJ923_01235, partial [Candidatus Omnitrophica bacterium]|nr:hypothetical protein [Candidatus Omnitrophota bacterium]
MLDLSLIPNMRDYYNPHIKIDLKSLKKPKEKKMFKYPTARNNSLFKSIGIILLIILTLSFFGCTPKEGSGKSTITVWHWMTDREATFKELAEKYEAETGVEVIFELYAPSDAYSQKVRAAAQGQN